MSKTSWKYFERKIAKNIAGQWGLTYNENIIRTPGSGSMANFKGDIIVIGEQFPLHLECKFGYDFSLEDIVKNKAIIKSFIKQAKEDAPSGKIPVVLVSKPYYGVYAIISTVNVNKTVLKPCKELSFFMITDKYLVVLVEELKIVYDRGLLLV